MITISNESTISVTNLMWGCLKDLSRFNNAAVEYSVTYIADASVNSMYDVPMPGLPNFSQVTSDVMYDVARARAKEWIKNHLPTASQSTMPTWHNTGTSIRTDARIEVGKPTLSAILENAHVQY